uniref:Uncharacterized protein n=1 Tax=Leersia perrieri TaxID=77586 RepID=A0A0D9XU42_9ORYZ
MNGGAVEESSCKKEGEEQNKKQTMKTVVVAPGVCSDPTSGRLYLTEDAIMEILSRERKPVQWWVRPEDAARFERDQERRMEYQSKVRKEYEATGFFRLPDDYFERMEQAQAFCDAALEDGDQQSPDPEQSV